MTVLWTILALAGIVFVAATLPGVYLEHRRHQRALRTHLAILEFQEAMEELGKAVAETGKQISLFVEAFKEAGRAKP